MSWLSDATSWVSDVVAWFPGFLESLAGPWLYVMVPLLTFGETAALLGLLVPGETGLFLAGAVAATGEMNLPTLVVLASAGAIAGDTVGWYMGHRFGPRIKTSFLGRKIGAKNWERAEAFLLRRRGSALVLGRWVGILRAIIPATAGVARVPYRRFLPWDVLGCVTWATTCVVVGYVVGDRWKEVGHQIGRGGLVLGGAVLVAFVAMKVVKDRRMRTAEPAAAEAVAAFVVDLDPPEDPAALGPRRD